LDQLIMANREIVFAQAGPQQKVFILEGYQKDVL
jgi:hypothetical protein